MPEINPIIVEKLKEVVHSNPDIPSEVEELIMRLLRIERVTGGHMDGIIKLYDHVLQQYINNSKIIEWSSRYED